MRGNVAVVRKGDTLYSIAFRHNLDYRQLAAWNGIGSNFTIYPGQRLRLSPPPHRSAPRRTAAITPATPSPPISPSTPVKATPVPASAPIPSFTPSGAFDPRHWRWPANGQVVTPFNPPKEKGINIGGHYGASVVAAAPGTVVYSGNALKGYGELIIIKHSDDYLSAYGFNSRRVVHEGQQVEAGQLIAQMGEGPGQTPELHFEIRYRGQPVDPRKYLPSR